MSRATYIIGTEFDRKRLLRDIERAPLGFRVECKRSKRSNPQNARMWAMLTDVSQQTDWHGTKLAPEDWKLIFMAGLNQELRLVPNLEGNGFVQLGRSSSKLTVEEMGELMELIEMFCAKHGVTLHEKAQAA